MMKVQSSNFEVRIGDGFRCDCGAGLIRNSRFAIHNLSAFTLIELLVVIAIIGLLMAVGIPAFKGFGKSNAIAAADRQLLDDLAFARQRAIAEHTTVYVVFLPPAKSTFSSSFPVAQQTQITNLLQQQYATYAFFVERSVGDQPGIPSPRYLTAWKTLPEGIFIATGKYFDKNYASGVTNFEFRSFPFPAVTNTPLLSMPYLAFNHLGQLSGGGRENGSEVIPLARGSIFYDANLNADVLENPPGNSATNSSMWHHIRIDGLTGRARVEQQEIQ